MLLNTDIYFRQNYVVFALYLGPYVSPSAPQIHLVPQSLARKRVWNKKYPVCIELGKQEDFMSKAQGERAEAGDERPEVGEDRVDNGERAEGEEPRRPPSVVASGGATGGAAGGASTGGGGLTLFLFGRTGRDKEEWFRRFLLASGLRWEGRGGGSGSGACKSGRSPHQVIHTLVLNPLKALMQTLMPNITDIIERHDRVMATISDSQPWGQVLWLFSIILNWPGSTRFDLARKPSATGIRNSITT